jgi:hypothetical protein
MERSTKYLQLESREYKKEEKRRENMDKNGNKYGLGTRIFTAYHEIKTRAGHNSRHAEWRA